MLEACRLKTDYQASQRGLGAFYTSAASAMVAQVSVVGIPRVPAYATVCNEGSYRRFVPRKNV